MAMFIRERRLAKPGTDILQIGYVHIPGGVCLCAACPNDRTHRWHSATIQPSMEFAMAVRKRKATSKVMIKSRQVSKLVLRWIGWRVSMHIGHEIAPVHTVFAHIQEHKDFRGVINFRKLGIDFVRMSKSPSAIRSIRALSGGKDGGKATHVEVHGHRENAWLNSPCGGYGGPVRGTLIDRQRLRIGPQGPPHQVPGWIPIATIGTGGVHMCSRPGKIVRGVCYVVRRLAGTCRGAGENDIISRIFCVHAPGVTQLPVVVHALNSLGLLLGVG